ncbi:hypothetical protein MCUN1_003635 [Malassezia cuniculi]|uniref:Stress-response A/B barrel domain-containing protein n=1 Tax=Malassezia cuniculi TaxID=948313 RepID=A0AAF0J7Z5_9BASI|nr:hypothetical protein MCUN1_003635 [Malassezia cuniculi]
MPYVKQQVVENGFEEFKARCETLRDVQAAKDEATEIKWGPPVWDARAHGFNYGLYTVFKTLEGLEKYKVDEEHVEYVSIANQIRPLSYRAQHRWYAETDQTSLPMTLRSK